MNTVIKSQKPLWKRVTKKIHLWIGLSISIPLFVMVVTGIILSGIFLTNEIQTKFSRAAAYIPNGNDVQNIITLGEKYEQNGFKMQSIKFPYQQNGHVVIQLKNIHNNTKRVLIDVTNYEVVSVKNGQSVESILVNIHDSLFIPKQGGNIVGIVGIFLFLMCITGLIIWLPKRQNLKFNSIPNFKLKMLPLYANLHKPFGIWTLVLLLTISVTGVSMIFNKQFASLISNFSQVRDFKKSPQVSEINHNSDISKISNTVLASIKNFGIHAVFLPQNEKQAYRFALRTNNPREKIMVFIDSGSNILEISNPRDYSNGEYLLSFMSTLHKGFGFGILWRLAQIVTGIATILFIITGFLIWLKKKQREKLNK